MRRLIFATNNKHKVTEVRAALSSIDDIEIVTLAEAGLHGEIPETAHTLHGNALQKALWVWERTHTDTFADDTGLEVDALGGAPGVYSARYAGPHCSFDDNIDKLLANLHGKENRKAHFRTVICLIEGPTTHHPLPTTHYFEGRVDGQILTSPHSNGQGFGYDPIFMPLRFALSFAEMPLELKNTISHRALAVKKLKDYLLNS